LRWLAVGRLDVPVLAWTLAIIVVSCAALAVFHFSTAPDVSVLRAHTPRWAFDYYIAFLIVFSAVNALMEELIFRGVLFDALESQFGRWVALGVQAVVFGMGHTLGGYPPGVLGGVLATIYGLMQGGLRIYSRGLAASWAAHIF